MFKYLFLKFLTIVPGIHQPTIAPVFTPHPPVLSSPKDNGKALAKAMKCSRIKFKLTLKLKFQPSECENKVKKYIHTADKGEKWLFWKTERKQSSTQKDA